MEFFFLPFGYLLYSNTGSKVEIIFTLDVHNRRVGFQVAKFSVEPRIQRSWSFVLLLVGTNLRLMTTQPDSVRATPSWHHACQGHVIWQCPPIAVPTGMKYMPGRWWGSLVAVWVKEVQVCVCVCVKGCVPCSKLLHKVSLTKRSYFDLIYLQRVILCLSLCFVFFWEGESGAQERSACCRFYFTNLPILHSCLVF